MNQLKEDDAQDGQPVFGEAMQRVFAKRGYDMSLEEAREFVRTLLRLFEIGALVFADEEGNRVGQTEP